MPSKFGFFLTLSSVFFFFGTAVAQIGSPQGSTGVSVSATLKANQTFLPQGYVMGLNGQLIPVSANPVPVGFMVDGKLVSPLLPSGVSAEPLSPTVSLPTPSRTQIQRLGDLPSDGTKLPPPGVVRVPFELQADGPDFSPLEEIPTNIDRQTHNRLTRGDRVRTLLPDIPLLKPKPETDLGEPIDLNRWSTGISVVTNGLAARLADDAGLSFSSWGLGIDAGRKVSRKWVARGKSSLSFVTIPANDALSGMEVEGLAVDVHGVLDWHPLENGFRTSFGAGIAMTSLSSDLNATTVRRTHFSPYLGIGYDSSLFRSGPNSGRDFAPWVDFGLVGFTNDVHMDGMVTNMAPQLNFGVKRRW